VSKSDAAPSAAITLDPAARAAFREWVLRIADDELTIGHRHSEWTGVGPDIESDVAMSSIAQEELGHARLFYEQLAGDGPGGLPHTGAGDGSAGTDRLAFGRPPAEFRNAVLLELPNAGWEFSIVRLALYEAFENLRLGLLAHSGQEPLAALAATLAREERYHGLFAATWLERLAGASAGARARVQAALDTAWPYALGFFETTDADGVLQRAGVLRDPAERQREAWEATVRSLLERCALIPPAGQAHLGGRRGMHTPALADMHAAMTEVWASDPEARW
jgi:ring-1,2-phenylacetyl-CoA epoxidase subunit PaaC